MQEVFKRQKLLLHDLVWSLYVWGGDADRDIMSLKFASSRFGTRLGNSLKYSLSGLKTFFIYIVNLVHLNIGTGTKLM